MIRPLLTVSCGLLTFGLVAGSADFAQGETKPEPEASTAPPAWLTEHMAWMVEHSPLRANNEGYRSEQEPFEAYFTEWKYGPGKHSLVGRLYGVRNGCASADFWSFRLFWDPVNRRVHSDQLGLSGAYGVGTMRDAGDGAWVTEQTFAIAGGEPWKDKHEIAHREQTQTTHSFTWSEGAWKPNRSYAWTGPAEKPKCGG